MEINRNSLTYNNLIWEHITDSLVVLKSCYSFFATYALIGLLLQIQFYDYFCFWKLFFCRNKNESYSEIKINNIVVRKCRHRHLKLYRLITSKIVFTEKNKKWINPLYTISRCEVWFYQRCLFSNTPKPLFAWKSKGFLFFVFFSNRLSVIFWLNLSSKNRTEKQW